MFRSGHDRGDGRASRTSTPTRPTPSGEGGFGLVEALISFIILSVGLLAVAGIALSVAAQTRDAAYMTDQDQAAQQVLEITATSDFADVSATTKDTTVSVGNASYTVTRTVTTVNARTKRIEVEVPGQGGDASEKMVTYMHLEN